MLKKTVTLCLALALLLPLFPARAQSSSPIQPETANAPDAGLGIAQGAHIVPIINDYGEEVAGFNQLVGKNLAVVMYFMDWNTANLNGKFFDDSLVNGINRKFGAQSPAIMLTWEPLSGSTPGCQSKYSGAIPIQDITNGRCDEYIRQFARALKARPERYLIRFAHEMNLAESPWWPGNYGLGSSAYVAMWRHVHDVFESQSVPNAEWVWAPNYESNPRGGDNDRNAYYPGDAYVDWIGVDGYNWYNHGWDTFEDLYDSDTYRHVLDDFSCRYAKPQILAEFGSVDGGPGKATWILDAYAKMANYPFLRAAVWFNDFAYSSPSAPDFRVTSSTRHSGSVHALPEGTGGWTNAYKQAIANPVFVSRLPSLQDATPPGTFCRGSSGPEYQISPASAQIDDTGSSTHTFSAMNIQGDLSLSLQVPSGSQIQGAFSVSTLHAPWGKSTLTLNITRNTPPGIYDVYVQGNGVNLAQILVNVVRTYSVSGSVKNRQGQGVGGVTVVLGELAQQTDASGNYTFQKVTAGTYTLAPHSPDHAYVPAARSIDLVDSDSTGQNFTQYPKPTLIIDHDGYGRPGSVFTVMGQNFPANTDTTVVINGVVHSNNLKTSSNGEIRFNFGTEQADPGIYFLAVHATTEAEVSFRLISDGDLWNGSGVLFQVKRGIPGAEIFLPIAAHP